MDDKKIVFEPVNWSPHVAASLSKATAPEEEFIAHEVKQGISQCWHIHGYGYLVTRLEIDENALVIVAGQGRGLLTIMSIMPAIAKANNANVIRLHSRRAGMARMLAKLNYEIEFGLGENIYYKQVA